MNIGLLLLRLAVGGTLAAHGAQKLFGGLAQTGKLMEMLGFHPGRRHGFFAGLAEFLGGLLLALGLLTPLGTMLVVSVMTVAVATVHWSKGFWITRGGFEYNFVLAAAAVSLALTGPGRFSLDAALGLPLAGAWWAIGAIVVAVLGAAGQLAQRRSQHDSGA